MTEIEKLRSEVYRLEGRIRTLEKLLGRALSGEYYEERPKMGKLVSVDFKR